MGLLQKACETYDCHIRLVGLPQAGEKKETLAPVSHILTSAQIEITLNQDETYGGLLMKTWFDRPLGLAGKVVVKGSDAFHPEVRLYDSEKPVAIIPSLAPHLKRGEHSKWQMRAGT